AAMPLPDPSFSHKNHNHFERSEKSCYVYKKKFRCIGLLKSKNVDLCLPVRVLKSALFLVQAFTVWDK
ncbi:MAG TPA: hypothetical protein PLU49_15140, partial [Saprospiraceae bacterium]|nr:hypothetical protein [Saprospiraceae bacterium]